MTLGTLKLHWSYTLYL